ncbi:sugar phosphate isomerase/epimerase family protein [Paludibaculum fermentans]|uniref:sugar phosphate isomerase/epimerase family protein n=1 Tax=Paludibaculum fermentans TaxID=1473598 RepID=UPI003EBA23E9
MKDVMWIRKLLTRPVKARITGWPPVIAVSSWSLHNNLNSGSLDIAEFPQLARDRFQVSVVELLLNHLSSTDDDYLRQIYLRASNAGVEIACLALDNDFTVLSPESDVEIARALDMIRKASLLGATVIRVNTGLRGIGTDDDLTRRVSHCICSLLPLCKTLNIRLALENQTPFGMRPEHITSIVRTVNSDYVGACVDWGNFYPEDLNMGPERLAPLTLHVHAKAYSFGQDGEESTINYAKRLRELREVDYGGVISVEWECMSPDLEIANTTIAVNLLRKHIAAL